MTPTDRTERAARAIKRGQAAGYNSETLARMALAEAFPEGIFSDPPTAWVAPMDATEGMCRRGLNELAIVDCVEDQREVYAAMRDAHLKEQGQA